MPRTRKASSRPSFTERDLLEVMSAAKIQPRPAGWYTMVEVCERLGVRRIAAASVLKKLGARSAVFRIAGNRAATCYAVK